MNSSAYVTGDAGSLKELLNMPLRRDNPYIQQWKEDGGKVFAYICTYIPEELLFAENGRILPVRAGASGCAGTDLADIYLHKFNCSYPRCLLQLGMEGEYDFLDGFVFLNGCEQLRGVYEIWEKNVKTPFLGMVTVPHVLDNKKRFNWYLDDLKKLREEISTKYAYVSTDDKLREVIGHYNKYRELTGELYKLRALEKPLLSGVEAMKIGQAAFSMPKDIFNQKLEAALKEIKQREGISDYRARIMVSGSYMDDTFLIDLIESTGALVVTDNLCFGRRHIEGMIEEEGDPLTAIAERYFFHNPCPRMMNTYDDRLAFTRRVAKEGNVDGIIFEYIPFCDNHGVECQMEAEDLAGDDLPTLILEREYIASDAGRLKTRIQAFLEKLGK